MSFLQPAMLFALPVIALPIIIHLINQRRFQTIRWAAMMFLLAANRMSRGYARLRQYLILAARTLAVAGLIFAVSRPLASGFLGLAGGGRVDTTIVLLDRSPSMQQRAADGRSKLDAGRAQLVQALSMLRSNHWVLIDSATNTAREIDSPSALNSLPEAEGVGASADLPSMMQAASDYIRDNRPSRSEVWIVSDVQASDWNSDSGRWPALRETFLESPHPVRFHLLAYADAAPENRAVRVTSVRRVESTSGVELLLSMRIEQSAKVDAKVTIPVTLEIDGARSEISAEMTASELDIKDYSIPLDAAQVRGWGKVSIPADANPADNDCYFVFDRPPPRRTVVVADDPNAVAPLELAAGISPDSAVACTTETIGPDQVGGVDWKDVALLLWQSGLPTVDSAAAIQAFLERGGQVIFFPPASPGSEEFAGISWKGWEELPEEAPVTSWVGDQDLLANAKSGAALPVGQLQVTRYCGLIGDHTSLATLKGGAPLLARALTDQRNIYFCATSTSPAESSLARDGVVLYVLVQRALMSGASSLGTSRTLVAGSVAASAAADWRLLSSSNDALSSAYAFQPGAYEQSETLLAVNRSEAEDRPAVVPPAKVLSLFDRLDFDRVEGQTAGNSPLIQEIWRLFLALMMAALFVEACLCLPRVTPKTAGVSPVG
jgi:hypothetical protein